MSVSTDGQICFGILFEEDFEFPWSQEEYFHDIEQWWLEEILQYKPPFKLYEDGGYIGGIKPQQEKIDEYYEHQNNFEKKNPLPVSLVNYCSRDFPIYILAVPSSVVGCCRGFPTKFKLEDLVVTEEEINKLVQFCKDHNIEYESSPQWYLSSYWG
jgi:hypothetical protein